MLCEEAKSDAYAVSTKQVSGTTNRVAGGPRRITENIGEVNSDAEGNEARLGETLAQVAEVARVSGGGIGDQSLFCALIFNKMRRIYELIPILPSGRRVSPAGR